MFAQRLAHLVLAPGALPYALLTFVVALIWLGVGTRPAHAPTTADSAGSGDRAASASRGTLISDGPLIDPEEAIRSARRFAGEPGLALDVGLDGDPIGARSVAIYYLESMGPPRGEDFFKVDARTAEVIEATFRSRLAPTTPPIDLGLSEAAQAAARYARDRFSGFDDLRLVDESSRASEGNVIHSFKWSQIAAESGAELPISVSIALSAGSGEIVWYLAQRDALQVDVRPTINRTRAVEMAAGAISGRGSGWDVSRPAVRLQVLYDEENHQQLVWSVTFPARQQGVRSTLRLLVNAHTGELLANGV